MVHWTLVIHLLFKDLACVWQKSELETIQIIWFDNCMPKWLWCIKWFQRMIMIHHFTYCYIGTIMVPFHISVPKWNVNCCEKLLKAQLLNTLSHIFNSDSPLLSLKIPNKGKFGPSSISLLWISSMYFIYMKTESVACLLSDWSWIIAAAIISFFYNFELLNIFYLKFMVCSAYPSTVE